MWMWQGKQGGEQQEMKSEAMSIHFLESSAVYNKYFGFYSRWNGEIQEMLNQGVTSPALHFW